MIRLEVSDDGEDGFWSVLSINKLLPECHILNRSDCLFKSYDYLSDHRKRQKINVPDQPTHLVKFKFNISTQWANLINPTDGMLICKSLEETPQVLKLLTTHLITSKSFLVGLDFLLLVVEVLQIFNNSFKINCLLSQKLERGVHLLHHHNALLSRVVLLILFANVGHNLLLQILIVFD